MKKINIEVVDPYQEYFKFNKVYCEHNGVKIQSLVDILGYVDDLKDDTVVAECSLVNDSFSERNSLIGGIPAKVLRTDVYWCE